MRYERTKDIVRLAMRLQGSRGGMTLDDIMTEFSISRRTAERLRDAVDEAFGPLIRVEDRDINEMCWHLITWEESVTVERPAKLRRHLANMCKSLAAHHVD